MKTVRAFALCLALTIAATPGDPASGEVDTSDIFLTVEDVIKMESAGEFEFSPDGRWVVWVKATANESKNKRKWNIYLTSVTEDLTLQMTRGETEDRMPKFSPNGERLAFVSARGDKAKRQIYILDLGGGEAKKVTSVSTGVRSYAWLDDGTFIYSAREDSTLRERKLKEDKDDAVIVADQEHYAPVRLFTYDVDAKKTVRFTTNPGVITSFSLSPDGKWVVTNENQSVDYQYDFRTPPKQYLMDVETGTRKEVFEAPFVNPHDFKWRNDSKGFYCLRDVASDSTDAYVSISRLYYYDVSLDSLARVDTGWDKGIGRSYHVVADGVIAALADGTVDRIAHLISRGDRYDVEFLNPEKPVRLGAATRNDKRIVYFSSDASSFPEVLTATVARDRLENRRKLLELNESLKKKTLSESEVIRWVGAEGDTVEGLLYYPVAYDTAYSYPLVVNLHGGPSGVDPDFFTERWSNYPHVLAAKGAFVLKVNYHGSGNYGLEWVESIKGRYYELEVPDILTGVDHLVAQGNVDEDALGIMGWSNGAILAIACCLETDRFKAMCAGAGDVNWTSDYGNCAFGAAFDNAYFGGPPWELPQVYVDKSPLFRMHQLQTPTLIMFGTEDTNVPTGQGWEHFRALQQIGAAPVRFLLFPGATHGLRKLSHQRRKMEEELAWFDRYLFNAAKVVNEAFDETSPLAWALEKARVKRVGYLIGEEVEASIVPEIVAVGGIRVSRFEITRAQFGAFDPHYDYPTGTDNYPVTNVSLPMAQAYCLWLSEKTGRVFRLPTVDEMNELLSVAKPNLKYENNLEYWLGYHPTPDELELAGEKIKELEQSRLLFEPVGSFRPAGGDIEKGKPGVYDLGGNVAEWVTDEKGQGRIMGLAAVSSRDERSKYDRPPLSYVGFRAVEQR